MIPVLHRRAAAALASACLLGLGPIPAVRAQTIVVTGAREPADLERLAADVVVIDAETIRRSSADSLADLLRREAGLQLTRNGGPGQNTGLFIRGASSGQTVVLVDGVRIGSATLGIPSFEGLPLDGIERIEVLRGPGSSLYGADAVGGVVQIVTRRGGGAPRLDAHLAAGGYGSAQASLGASGSVGAWDLAASLARERSDGVSATRPAIDTPGYAPYNPDRDGYRLDSGRAQVGFAPATGQRVGLTLLRTRLNAQFDGVQYAPPAYTPDSTPDFRNHLSTQVSALDWRGAFGSALAASAKLAQSVDDLATGGTLVDRYRTERTQAAAQLAWNAGAIGQWVGAVEQTEEKARSTSFAADVQRRDTALVLALTGAAGAWRWQADLRRDDSSDYGGVTTGRLGGAWVFAPGWRLRALAGTTFRAPSFNDLYYPAYGVPGLKPERGRSVELGLRWQGGASEAEATVYRNRVRDLIGYQPDRALCPADPAYDFGCAGNVARARLDGATLSARHRVGALALRAQADFTGAHDADTGARLARRAAHQESLGADWDGGAWAAGASVLRVGARTDLGHPLPAETTLDLTARWRVSTAWTLEAKLLNATDRDLQPAFGYQGLGRQGWLGLRYAGGL